MTGGQILSSVCRLYKVKWTKSEICAMIEVKTLPSFGLIFHHDFSLLKGNSVYHLT